MPGFFKKISSLFPKPPPIHILDAVWQTSNTVIVSLDRDWNSSWSMPPFALKSGRKIREISRVPPAFWGCGSGYYFDGDSIVFVFYPAVFRDTYVPVETVVYVAGTFNHWDALGKEEWKMSHSTFGQFDAWSLRVPRKRCLPDDGDAEAQFKFITSEGTWIEPPSGLFNSADDGRGNANLRLTSRRTGWNSFRLVCAPSEAEVIQAEELIWTRPREYHSVSIRSGYFLSMLYSAIELGAIVSRDGESTVFRTFAPRADGVSVYVRRRGNEEPRSLAMKAVGGGIWEAELAENLNGRHYDLFVSGKNTDNSTAFDPAQPLLDPYAKASVSRSGPGIVVDSHRFGYTKRHYTSPHLSDLVIAEVHLRDLIAKHPKYGVLSRPLGFRDLAEWVRSDDCYLKKLGVNAVELQPIQQFDSEKPEDYHWGYMTTNWFSPASAYASDPANASQMEEFRDLVSAFHEAGFTVILDVVYNHVGEPNHLFRIDKNYYFNIDPRGAFSNWSGCGNDFRAERPMGRRLVIDSLLWMIERYGVDGFRFDLAELVGMVALKGIESAVRARYPECILIAEPWSFRGHIAGSLRSTSYSSWNDGYRDYAAKYVHNAVNLDGLRYFISGSPEYFATFPAQTINYTESHDDRCWLDKITECANHNADEPTPADSRRTHLMFAFLLSSLGTPMLAEGQDFLRTKHGKNNTYLDGEENALDYARLKKFASSHRFVSRWIRFRLSPQGRLFRQRKNVPHGFFRFYPDQTNTAVAVVYNYNHAQGRLQYILVLNPRRETAHMQIPAERFLGFRQIANTEMFDFNGVPAESGAGFDATGILHLPPLSCALWTNRE